MPDPLDIGANVENGDAAKVATVRSEMVQKGFVVGIKGKAEY